MAPQSSPWPNVLLAGALLALTGCTDAGPGAPDLANRPPVTEEAALDLLTKVVDHTLAEDFEALCALAGSKLMCESDLRNGELNRAPDRAPRVVCSYVLPDVVTPNGRSLGGRVLVVDGTAGDGRHFVTEVLVFHDGHRFVATNAVWWSNRGIAFSSVPGSGSTAGAPVTPEARLQRCEGAAGG